MSTNAPTRERVILERLRENYEHRGYEFFAEPLPDMLPSFLGHCRPDAIALKQGDGVIIEIKSGRRAGREPRIEALAKLISGQPGWRLQVYFEGERSEDSVQIDPPTQRQIAGQLVEVERLAASGHRKAAMLLAWSVLEAIARARLTQEGASSQRPLSPDQTVQSLEMSGLVDGQVGRDLRAKAHLRNLIAHGDLSVDVEAGVLDDLLKRIRELSVSAADSTSTGH